MTEFTPWSALAGGALIGLAALLLLVLSGRIAGVSGILKSTLNTRFRENGWRLSFLLGLVLAPLLLMNSDYSLPTSFPGSWLTLVIGGLLVGVGTAIGSGCTSGHGICGIGRLSKRSILATILFMLSAIVTLYVARHLIGGVV